MKMKVLLVFLATVAVSACGKEEEIPTSNDADELPDVVFVRYDDQGSDLYGLDLENLSVQRLTNSTGMEEFPTWSGDAVNIAYLSMHEDQASINIRNLVTGDDTTIVTGIAEPVSWSGNSDSVVITKDFGDTRGLFVIAVDGTSESRIPTGADGDAYATWSPVSDEIAFESTRDGNPEIYSSGTDGTNVTRLTENQVLDEWPQWSSNGQHIAYASGVEGDKDLWVMRSDGEDKRQLTHGMLFGDAYPSWSPDDKQIVLTVQESETEVALVVVNVESGEFRRLVSGAAPSWRPTADGRAVK